MKLDDGSALNARALITQAGDAQVIVTAASALTAQPQFVVYGNVCCAASVDKKLDSIAYFEERVRDGTFKAAVVNGSLVGAMKVRGTDYEFSLGKSPRYDEALTLQDLSGTYSRTTIVFLGPDSTYTITVDPSGQVTGSHTNGCVYNGAISLPDASHNIFKLDMQLANCPRSISGSGSADGHYSGLGLLLRDVTAPSDATKRTNVLYHSLVGPTWLGQQPTER
jgi:hypothetical protein